MLKLAASGAGFACTWDRDTAHAELMEIVFDRGVAVAAVSGHRPWWASGSARYPLDSRRQLRCIVRVSDHDAVVEDDPVGVIDDLSLVAELHRLA